jgi:hypothetical protein
MVIHYFHILDAAIFPDKANSVPVIDPDAVLAAPIAMQGFQLISRRYLEIIDCVRRIEHFQFPPRCALNGLKSPDPAILIFGRRPEITS